LLASMQNVFLEDDALGVSKVVRKIRWLQRA
jgi:hypothetical protein